MSGLSELIREGPVYKRAVLAVALTAGVGACVYLGYRCATGGKKPGRGPSKPEKKVTPSPEKKVIPSPKDKEPLSGKEEQLSVKPEAAKTGPAAGSPSAHPEDANTPLHGTASPSAKPEDARTPLDGTASPSVKPEDVVTPVITPSRSVITSSSRPGDAGHVGTPLRADELSTSGTFEKISLGTNNLDNFEHVTMSQIHPLGSSTLQEKKEEAQVEELVSSTAFPQTTSDIGASTIGQPETFENLSMSQVEQSISIISTAEEEKEEAESSNAEEPEFSEEHSEGDDTVIEVSDIKADDDDDDDVQSAAVTSSSGVMLKDENDIVVMEPSSEESGSEKSEEEKGPRSGMAAVSSTDHFDSSSISPVFGRQEYHRVSVGPEELDAFDPSKAHPASFGFKFGAEI